MRKNYLLILSLIVFSMSGLHAQVFELDDIRAIDDAIKPAALVHAAQVTGEDFEPVSLFKSGVTKANSQQHPEIARTLSKAVLPQIDTRALANFMKSNKTTFSLSIPTTEGPMVVDLVQVRVLEKGVKVRTSSMGTVQVNPGLHYRGIIKGEKNSIVALSVIGDEIAGFMSSPNTPGNYVVGKLRSKTLNSHVVYNDADVKTSRGFGCATKPQNISYTRKQLLPPPPSKALSDCVRTYVEVDFNVYQDQGSSVNQTVTYITSLFNQAIALFAQESINMQVSDIFVWTSASPYSGGTDVMLDQFQRTRSSMKGDIGHLISFLSTSTSAGGIAAGFAGICPTNFDQSLCVTQTGNSFNTGSPIPPYSRSVKVVTHEMGHLLGSVHTHNCSWNGDNTVIDGCAAPEGSCSQPAIPANFTGTIMSYCDSRGTAPVDFANGFGPQPRAVIQNSVTNGNCLVGCGCSCPSNITTALAPGTCSKVVNYDNTGCLKYEDLTAGLPSGSLFPKGITTVSYDIGGSPCSFTVNVQGTLAPGITCPPGQTVNNTPGKCEATVIMGNALAIENCPSGTVNSTSPTAWFQYTSDWLDFPNEEPNGTAFQLNISVPPTGIQPANSNGSLTISMRGDINSSSERFTVSGETGGSLGNTANGGECDISYTNTGFTLTSGQINSWGSDGIITLTLTPNSDDIDECALGNAFANLTYTYSQTGDNITITNSFNANGKNATGTYPVGTTIVTFTADDGTRTGQCTTTIQVNDNEGATLAFCPADMFVCENDPAFYNIPRFDDNCDGPNRAANNLKQGQLSGTVFPVGVNTVRWGYTDNAGNPEQNECSFKVTVWERPQADNDTIYICDRDNVNFDLQAHVNNKGNGVLSTFEWRAVSSSASVSGFSTTTQTTGVIDDVLINDTRFNQRVKYRVDPTSATVPPCPGPPFYIDVVVWPSPEIQVLPANTCAGEYVNIASLVLDYHLLAVTFDFYDGDPTTTGQLIASTSALQGRPRTPVVVNPAATTTYYVTGTTIHGCTKTVSFAVTVQNSCLVFPSIVAKLEGAYNPANGKMRTSLNSGNLIPVQEPYSAMGYIFTGGGGEMLTPAAQQNPNIVDWVVVELRDATNPQSIVHSRAALLLKDGKLVDTDGVNGVEINVNSQQAYYVAIIHRNHLGVMTANPILPGTAVDFTDPALAIYGQTPSRAINNGTALLVAGDADGNGQIQNSDDVFLWMPNAGSAGYKAGDYNLDGQVQNSDRILIWNKNVGRGTSVPR